MGQNWMLRTCLVGALVGAAPGVAAAADWRDHTYAKDGFAVAAPTALKMTNWPGNSPQGRVENHFYESDFPDPDHPYQVIVIKYPADVDEQQIIKATKNSQANASKGGVIGDEHDVTLDGVPGAEYTVTYPSATFHVRMFVKGDTTYQATVAWKTGTPPGDFERFFASFRFTSK